MNLIESGLVMAMGLYLIVVSIGDLTSGITLSPIGGVVGITAGVLMFTAGVLVILWTEKELYAELIGIAGLVIAMLNTLLYGVWGTIVMTHIALYIAITAVLASSIAFRRFVAKGQEEEEKVEE
mgnify:CR=1 FL=1